MPMNNTIIALSSALGTGAIAVIRMSGESAFCIFEKAVNKKNCDFAHSQIKRFEIIDKNGDIIDDVMAATFFAPKSFTGENVVEIFCHGSPITIERIIKRMIEFGAKTAQKGEFTKRAFLNGKIDLHKAEAINAVISAKDYYSHKNAMSQYFGAGREFFDKIKEKLQEILSDIESQIEFSETDDLGEENENRKKLQKVLSELSVELKTQKENFTNLKKIKNGFPVVLAGRTNAGKSSLFNALLKENRAIVNAKAGTTRDVITETVSFDEVVIRLTDTAGLNESKDEIENEGIERTKKEIEKAAAVFWVINPEDETLEEDYEIVKNVPILIAVLNKNDLSQNSIHEEFLKEKKIFYEKTSVLRNFGINNIISLLVARILQVFPEKDFCTILTSEREFAIIENLLELIENSEFLGNDEIVAESIREMLKALGEIYGFIAPDEIMNKIFDNFCIGK
jgi:tRNA modification GTPase